MVIDVKAAQRQLNRLGFGPLVVDGIAGMRTAAAVSAYQRSIGLPATGRLDARTMSALMAPAPESDIPWLAEALAVLGLHEERDRSRLRAWFDRSVAWIDPREVPWCGAFVATCLRKWRPDIVLPDNPLAAKSWARFGVACQPQLGAIITLHRGAPSDFRGHVFFYLGETATEFYGVGGNQSNAVTRAWFAKSRLHSSRAPAGFQMPGKVIRLARSGEPLSVNEA
jgi:uncharacterized protein (TIGR02594 family)